MTPETIDTLAPEIERGLLGACLTYHNAAFIADGILKPEYFSEQVHRSIWTAVTELTGEGRPVTPVTIGALLGNPDVYQGLTLRKYLAQLTADVHCPLVSVADFAKQIREQWALRLIADQASDLTVNARLPGSRAKELISGLIQSFDQTRAILEGRNSGSRSSGDVVVSLVDRLERQRHGEIVENCVPTCLRDLDRKLTGGVKPGELIVIAGRPGMGKSLLAISMARQMARQGRAGGFFSLEMIERQTGARMFSDALYSSTNTVTASQILQNQLSEHDARRVFDVAAELKDLPLFIDDTSSLTVSEVGARARSMRQKFERQGKQLEFIVIDYLKFVKASDRYRGQRHYEVGEISAGLKALAKDLGISVFLLAQLNRKVEERSDKRPELADLRESGDLEADADVVLLLYREAYYLANDARLTTDPSLMERLSACENKLTIIVGKQRMGSTGQIDVFCHPGACAVRDLMRTA